MKGDDYKNVRDARLMCDILSLALRPAPGKEYPTMDVIRRRVERISDLLNKVVPRSSKRDGT